MLECCNVNVVNYVQLRLEIQQEKFSLDAIETEAV